MPHTSDTNVEKKEGPCQPLQRAPYTLPSRLSKMHLWVRIWHLAVGHTQRCLSPEPRGPVFRPSAGRLRCGPDSSLWAGSAVHGTLPTWFSPGTATSEPSQWQPNSYKGYSLVAVDPTAFWQPRLKGGIGKFFHRIANRALKGIGLGLIVRVGRVGDRRILPRRPRWAKVGSRAGFWRWLPVTWASMKSWYTMPGPPSPTCRRPGFRDTGCGWPSTAPSGAIGCHPARRRAAHRNRGKRSVRCPEPTKVTLYRLPRRISKRPSHSKDGFTDGKTW